MAYKCELFDYYDVWGNVKDGWEVMNASREYIFYMSDKFTDEDIIKKLIDIEYLEPDVTMESLEIWNVGDIFEVFKADDGLPLFRIELYDIKPIAVLTLSNWGGIAILEINEHDEELTYQWYDNAPEKVQYYYEYDKESDETEAFFLIGETKYYFNEFMVI